MTTKDEIEKFLSTTAFNKDRYGNFKNKSGNLRYKIGKKAIRKESKVKHESGGSDWVRIWSAYYKNIDIVNGKMRILKGN